MLNSHRVWPCGLGWPVRMNSKSFIIGTECLKADFLIWRYAGVAERGCLLSSWSSIEDPKVRILLPPQSDNELKRYFIGLKILLGIKSSCSIQQFSSKCSSDYLWPGDGIGIRVRLKSEILRVRLPPGLQSSLVLYPPLRTLPVGVE